MRFKNDRTRETLSDLISEKYDRNHLGSNALLWVCCK